MINRYKVAFVLDHSLMEYRVPFFKLLVDRGYEVNVFYSSESSKPYSYPFNVYRVPVFKFLGLSYRKIPGMSAFDIVVCMQNIRVINLWHLTLNPFKEYKLIHWGIGTSSARGLSLTISPISRLRNFLSKFASAQVLYSEFPLPLFSRDVVEKTFIANNTIYNPEACDLSEETKDCFLFIGSLNKRKGLDLLIRAFSDFLAKVPDPTITKLVIIGNGPEESGLVQLTKELKIAQHVDFVGNVSDSGIKKRYFSRALASISPSQAGLSVLESFSYGVPFLCFSNAISGGEHLNIINGENGFLINKSDELSQRMIELDAKLPQSARLGKNAFNFYMEKRQMKHMIDGFVAAFDYVLKS